MFSITRILAVAVTGLTLSPGLAADTIKVSAKGDIKTISEGVAAATAGDTVSVASGLYTEVVTVPAGKDNLKIIAKGKVTLDARPNGALGSGPGFTVESNGVTIQGFTIRHPRDNEAEEAPALGVSPLGDGIYATGSDISVLKCGFLNCENTAVTIVGDDARIDGCTVFATGTDAFFVIGDSAEVTRNSVRSSGGLGVKIVGGMPVVSRNSFLNCSSVGILLADADGGIVSANMIFAPASEAIITEGAGMLIEKNKIDSTYNTAILHLGSGVTISGNTIENCESGIDSESEGGIYSKNKIKHVDSNGIAHIGTGATIDKNTFENLGSTTINLYAASGTKVTNNKVKKASGSGLDAEGDEILVDKNNFDTICRGGIEINGDMPTITRNTLKNIARDGSGISVQNAPGGGLIDGNKITDATDHGIDLRSTTQGFIVNKNQIKNAGNSGENGINVRGMMHTVTDNKVEGAVNDGINVEGHGHRIDGNKVTKNAVDGIDIESGTANEVTTNSVTSNGAEGIENNAMGTTISDNTAKSNRTDYANDGSVATFTDNKSGDDTGDSQKDMADPEID